MELGRLLVEGHDRLLLMRMTVMAIPRCVTAVEKRSLALLPRRTRRIREDRFGHVLSLKENNAASSNGVQMEIWRDRLVLVN